MKGTPCLLSLGFKLVKPTKKENGEEEKDVNESKLKRQERQEISIGRKSKSVGGRGWDLFQGGREEFCGDHRLHFERRNEVSRNNNLI